LSATSDRYIIGGLLGIREVGIYAATYALILGPFAMVSTMLITTLRPVLFESVSSGNEVRTRRTIVVWLVLLSIVCAAGATAIIILRMPIASLLLATEYRAGVSFIPWLVIGFPLLSFSQVFNTVAMAYKYSLGVTISEGVGAVSSILLTIPMVRAYGLMGAAAAVPFYYGLQCICAAVLAGRARRHFRSNGASVAVALNSENAGRAE
jgi:O-antigen/teichoic acid export membrane protein